MKMQNPFFPAEGLDIKNRDRLLPEQELLRWHFAGNTTDFYNALNAMTNSVLPIKSVHEKFKIKLAPDLTYEAMGSDLSTLHFLQMLVRLTSAKRVLEIGTYIGVSTMFLAEAAGPSGKIITIEKGQEFADIAELNFLQNGLWHRIENFCGDAALLWPRWCDMPFDMIFLDGAKEQYHFMLPELLHLLRPGGLLVVDDVFCQGDTLNLEPRTDKGRGVRDMLEQVKALGPAYSPVILPYGDGLLLLRKPA